MTPAGGHAGLHIVYRSHGGENRKDRPDWYSKRLALLSLARAVDRVSADIVFVNDGPVPEGLTRLMDGLGEVVQIAGGSNRSSMRWCLGLARRRAWPQDDLVLFLEDDYLLRPTALSALLTAAQRHARVDYFAIYGHPEDGPTDVAPQPGPVTGADPEPDGWVPYTSTTSTFAVRVAALLEDETLMRLLPFTGGAWDHTTCMVVQGRRPFRARDIFRPHPPAPGTPAVRRTARLGALVAVRLLAQVRSHRLPRNKRRLLGPMHPVATHMELGLLSAGTDWAALAEQTSSWWESESTSDVNG